MGTSCRLRIRFAVPGTLDGVGFLNAAGEPVVVRYTEEALTTATYDVRLVEGASPDLVLDSRVRWIRWLSGAEEMSRTPLNLGPGEVLVLTESR